MVYMLDKYQKIMDYINNTKETMFSYQDYKIDNEYTVRSIHYIYKNPLEFKRLPAWYRELRGIVYVLKNGEPVDVFLPINSFKTFGQYPETSMDALRNKEVKAVSTKLDGSMIIPYRVKGQWQFKSHKSFNNTTLDLLYSEISNIDNVVEMLESMYQKGYILLFEFISPHNRIVVDYDQSALRLIQIRERATGKYVPLHIYQVDAKVWGVQTTETHRLPKGITFEQFYNDMVHNPENPWHTDWHSDNFEGVVVQFKDGTMLKVKTPMYLDRHKILSFNPITIKEDRKQLINIILDQKLDELDPIIMERYRIYIEKVNDHIIHQYHGLANSIKKY
jgi:T4 RnlA family RNA ligase